MPLPICLRLERGDDAVEIHRLEAAAFEREDEAKLVDALRCGGGLVLSAVAALDGQVVGHLAFSPLHVGAREEPVAVALAPVAVAPQFQRRGIGSQLIRWGLGAARDAGHGAVIVVGHPEFYPRFGFRPAAEFGLECPFPAPPESFLAVELQPGALADCRGVVRYHSAFGGV
jgi:putative acetyltransferase